MKTIIEMAREAGMAGFDGVVHAAFQLEAFAALVRADEREACAKVCEDMRVGGAEYEQRCENAIRARGNS